MSKSQTSWALVQKFSKLGELTGSKSQKSKNFLERERVTFLERERERERERLKEWNKRIDSKNGNPKGREFGVTARWSLESESESGVSELYLRWQRQTETFFSFLFCWIFFFFWESFWKENKWIVCVRIWIYDCHFWTKVLFGSKNCHMVELVVIPLLPSIWFEEKQGRDCFLPLCTYFYVIDLYFSFFFFSKYIYIYIYIYFSFLCFSYDKLHL